MPRVINHREKALDDDPVADVLRTIEQKKVRLFFGFAERPQNNGSRRWTIPRPPRPLSAVRAAATKLRQFTFYERQKEMGNPGEKQLRQQVNQLCKEGLISRLPKRNRFNQYYYEIKEEK